MVLEAALILPVLLVIVFASIEFGYAFYVKHTLQGAAREGARAGIVPGADNSRISAACADAMSNGGMSGVSYTVSITNTSGGAVNASSLDAGDPLVVEVRAPWSQFSVFLSGFGNFVNGDLTGRTVMRREG
ncbi:MAG: TadE/TadG family type IV pilus assembly protein [Planctomycetota bacterium]